MTSNSDDFVVNTRCIYYKRWYRAPGVPWGCNDTRLKEHYCVLKKGYCYNCLICADGIVRKDP